MTLKLIFTIERIFILFFILVVNFVHKWENGALFSKPHCQAMFVRAVRGFQIVFKNMYSYLRDIIICTRREIWIAISVCENSMAFSTFGDPL